MSKYSYGGKMREHFSRVKDGVLVAVQRGDAGRVEHETGKTEKFPFFSFQKNSFPLENSIFRIILS